MDMNEVRDFIKQEISGKDDGMNSVIFQNIVDKPIAINNGSNQRIATTFGRLIASNADQSNLNARTTDSFLDSLKRLYPTLHVAIPDIDEHLGQNWDSSNPLDVLYHPDLYAFEIEKLEVFTPEGDTYSLSPCSISILVYKVKAS